MPSEIPAAALEAAADAVWELGLPALLKDGLSAAFAALWVPDDPKYHDGRWRLVQMGRSCVVARHHGCSDFDWWQMPNTSAIIVTRVCLLPLPQGDGS